MDAKAADFDTSALTAQVASVQEPANEPVAEEVQQNKLMLLKQLKVLSQNKQAVNHHLERQPSQKHLRNN
ncbi:hypothetical protein [Streptococcus thermophilus]|uniref:hypothetical protein n=1 Tax=Streptococcus thermophilus TaxID=1308 RepID=UPI0022FF41C6|nr:hypothetical protein [Streptococcus thermophilus]